MVLENNIIQRNLRDMEQISVMLNEDVMSTLTPNELTVVHYMYLNETITVKTAAEVLKRSPPIARRVLNSLKEKNIFIWHGLHKQDPTQYFTLNVPPKKKTPDVPSAW